MATKRFLRFFLSFVTTKQFYAGITTALICVGLSVFFCTMHNFIGISFALLCAYITIYPLISRKHPGNTWRTGRPQQTDPSSPYSPHRRCSGRAAGYSRVSLLAMLIFSCNSLTCSYFYLSRYAASSSSVFFTPSTWLLSYPWDAYTPAPIRAWRASAPPRSVASTSEP